MPATEKVVVAPLTEQSSHLAGLVVVIDCESDRPTLVAADCTPAALPLPDPVVLLGSDPVGILNAASVGGHGCAGLAARTRAVEQRHEALASGAPALALGPHRLVDFRLVRCEVMSKLAIAALDCCFRLQVARGSHEEVPLAELATMNRRIATSRLADADFSHGSGVSDVVGTRRRIPVLFLLLHPHGTPGRGWDDPRPEAEPADDHDGQQRTDRPLKDALGPGGEVLVAVGVQVNQIAPASDVEAPKIVLVRIVLAHDATPCRPSGESVVLHVKSFS